MAGEWCACAPCRHTANTSAVNVLETLIGSLSLNTISVRHDCATGLFMAPGRAADYARPPRNPADFRLYATLSSAPLQGKHIPGERLQHGTELAALHAAVCVLHR